MSIVLLKDVQFSYGEGPPVLEGVDLELTRGNISVLMGPSGVGKTTLLRLINLLENPLKGGIVHNFKELSGDEGSDPLSLRRKMSFVFQEPALIDCSVGGNVAYGLMTRSGFINHLWKKTKNIFAFLSSNYRSVEKKVEQALARVGLEDYGNRSIRALSAGEHRRVSLARSLVTNPELLLLDEPTGNLDPRNTSIVEDIIREVKTRKTTVFLASHDMHQAERVGEEVFLLLGGEIVESGSAEKVFNSPRNKRTKDFINGRLVY
ncbi:ATP-binding cassette domain-containing protein [Candidatus Bipolaricaulota bacterium]|nr:ATP-binding cassette domain-containing protein [Candidatus Bipolaricaulota bacterium]